MSDQRDELYEKYRVERTDGGHVGPCIVLEFGDRAAWPALLAWASSVEDRGLAQLAVQVRGRVEAAMDAARAVGGQS